jgi:hypothetical protein
MDVDNENKVKRLNLSEKSYLDLALNHPDAYKKFDEESRKKLRDYVINNRADFCKICGLNLKFAEYLVSSDEYQAIVISPLDGCTICGAKGDKLCEIDIHQRYHRTKCSQ